LNFHRRGGGGSFVTFRTASYYFFIFLNRRINGRSVKNKSIAGAMLDCRRTNGALAAKNTTPISRVRDRFGRRLLVVRIATIDRTISVTTADIGRSRICIENHRRTARIRSRPLTTAGIVVRMRQLRPRSKRRGAPSRSRTMKTAPRSRAERAGDDCECAQPTTRGMIGTRSSRGKLAPESSRMTRRGLARIRRAAIVSVKSNEFQDRRTSRCLLRKPSRRSWQRITSTTRNSKVATEWSKCL